MGIFDGIKECKLIYDILLRNGLVGNKIFFDKCFIIDKDKIEKEVLFLCSPRLSSYCSIFINIDGVEKQLLDCPLSIITLVYLKVQSFEREFKKEIE